MSLQNLLLCYYIRKKLKRKPSGQSPQVLARVMRRTMERLPFRVQQAPRGFVFEAVDQEGVQGEWVYQPERPTTRTLLYLHGGGYIAGSPSTHRSLTMALAKALPARLLVLDYRLAPEHTYPAALDDAERAYHWLLRQGVLPENLGIAGDSAGGGLALSLLTLLRDRKQPLPRYGVLFSPWTDLTASGSSLDLNETKDVLFYAEGIRVSARIYPGAADPADPLVSPVFADYTGFPPLLLFASTSEVLLDDTLRVADKARAAGVPVDLQLWPNLPHVWVALVRILPEARRAVRHVARFVGSLYEAEPARSR
jgi:epsilon-lactone hydrolase